MKKTTKQRLLFLSGLSLTALTVAVLRMYDRRPRERIPSREGLEDPEVAAGYQRVSQLPQMRLMRKDVVQKATEKVCKGSAVDLGCGPGLLVCELAHRAPELHVTGIDLAPEMLAQAEASAQRAGLGGRVEFKVGDAGSIPLPDNSLDLVVSTLSLHHWRDPVLVFDEIARVLRPGGAFLIYDLRRNLAAPAWLAVWIATRVVAPAALRRINEPMASRDAAYTPEEVARMASQSSLDGWRVSQGPLWVMLEGIKGDAVQGIHRPVPVIWRLMRAMNPKISQAIRSRARPGELVLILETVGRVSGRPHHTPLQYERVGERIVVGSVRGQDADWFRNIVANPQVRVELKGNRYDGLAEPITDPMTIADFLELRLKRHPRMIRGMLLMHGLPPNPTRAQLEKLATQQALVSIRLGEPGASSGKP